MRSSTGDGNTPSTMVTSAQAAIGRRGDPSVPITVVVTVERAWTTGSAWTATAASPARAKPSADGRQGGGLGGLPLGSRPAP